MSINEIIENMRSQLTKSSFGDFNGKFQLIVNTTNSPVYFSIIISNGKVKFAQQEIDDMDCTIETDEGTLSALINGTGKPMTAFMTGKLKVSGNLDLALKFSRLLNELE